MAKSGLGYRTKAVALPDESLANSSELGMGLRTSWSGCSAVNFIGPCCAQALLTIPADLIATSTAKPCFRPRSTCADTHFK